MESGRFEGSYKKFIGPISDLIKEGKNFVDMSTTLYPKFYNDKEVRNAVETCVRTVLRFRILLDKKVDITELKKEVPWIFELRDRYPDTLQIAKATEDITHNILIDTDYFRLESSHKIDENAELILRNLIVKHPPRIIAKRLIQQFDNWWAKAKEEGI
jgi:hypothetical protein